MLSNRVSLFAIGTAMAIWAAACVAAAESVTPAAAPTDSLTPSPTNQAVATPAQPTPAPTVPPAAINVRVEDPKEYNFSPMFPFDSIRPIYDPIFANADEAELLDDELVMGVALNGETKAYPITVLRSREMVNDELGGIPILVTW